MADREIPGEEPAPDVTPGEGATPASAVGSNEALTERYDALTSDGGASFDEPIADDNLAVAPSLAEDERVRDLDAAERRGMGKGAVIGLTLAVLVVLLVGALVFFWNPWGTTTPPDNTAPVTTLPPESLSPSSSLAPATPVTPSAPPTATGTIAPPATATQTASAEPQRGFALNRWNWLADQQMFSVAGFVDAVESGGTCTLTATNGGTTLAGTAAATPDVSTTICVVNLSAPEAAAGSWQLTMTYDGPSGTAVSDAVSVNVP